MCKQNKTVQRYLSSAVAIIAVAAILVIIGIIFNVGVFMLGNLLFKTHKTAKTLGCMIGISYVISMIMQIVLIAMGKSVFSNPETINDISTIADLTTSTIMFNNIFHTILTIGLYIGLFFKLKTQKY